MSTDPQALGQAVACSAPLIAEPLSGAEAHDFAATFKALADPTRLRLLSLIASRRGGEACVCDLTEPVRLSQPTVSHHLRILADAGLVAGERRGKWVYYALVPGALEALAGVLRPEA